MLSDDLKKSFGKIRNVGLAAIILSFGMMGVIYFFFNTSPIRGFYMFIAGSVLGIGVTLLLTVPLLRDMLKPTEILVDSIEKGLSQAEVETRLKKELV